MKCALEYVKRNIIKRKISPIECRDTTSALALLGLICWLFSKQNYFAYISMALLVLGMAAPSIMTWPARFWLGFSRILGHIMSSILLSFIYIVFLLPMAAARQLFGKDPLRIKDWKKDSSSVFIVRNKKFTKDDMLKPF